MFARSGSRKKPLRPKKRPVKITLRDWRRRSRSRTSNASRWNKAWSLKAHLTRSNGCIRTARLSTRPNKLLRSTFWARKRSRRRTWPESLPGIWLVIRGSNLGTKLSSPTRWLKTRPSYGCPRIHWWWSNRKNKRWGMKFITTLWHWRKFRRKSSDSRMGKRVRNQRRTRKIGSITETARRNDIRRISTVGDAAGLVPDQTRQKEVVKMSATWAQTCLCTAPNSERCRRSRTCESTIEGTMCARWPKRRKKLRREKWWPQPRCSRRKSIQELDIKKRNNTIMRWRIGMPSLSGTSRKRPTWTQRWNLRSDSTGTSTIVLGAPSSDLTATLIKTLSF